MTTLEAVFLDRLERGGSDILYDIYHAAYCRGAGLPDYTPHSDPMRQLLWLLEDRRRVAEPPGWLRVLWKEADTLAPPPEEGWPE
jgi:hypothetical protein